MNKVEELTQAKNLLKKLITDIRSVFYWVDKINKTNLNKARKSFYSKDKFLSRVVRLEDKNIIV